MGKRINVKIKIAPSNYVLLCDSTLYGRTLYKTVINSNIVKNVFPMVGLFEFLYMTFLSKSNCRSSVTSLDEKCALNEPAAIIIHSNIISVECVELFCAILSK